MAEPSDGNVDHIAQAVTTHLQGLVAGCLSQGVTDGIGCAVDYIKNSQGQIQEWVDDALAQLGSGAADETAYDPATLLTPKIEGIIDQALQKGKGLILAGIQQWITCHASAATPDLQRAVDQILTHIMANAGELLFCHEDGIAHDVMPRIQTVVTETLKNAQAELMRSVATKMSDEAVVKQLLTALTDPIKDTVAHLVIETVAKQVAEKTGQPVSSVVESMTPYLTPMVHKALTQTMAYSIRWLTGWLQNHESEMSSLVNPFIEKTVQDVMPAVHKAVQDKALLLAQNKAQDIDFNRLAAQLAVAFADSFDPATLTSGAIKVGPQTQVVKELPKLLCLLMQTAETYECLGGNLSEPVEIDHLEIAGQQFNNIKIQLVPMPDGSVHIRHISFLFRDEKNVETDIEMTGISLDYQLPEKSKLYKAALLSGASMMNPVESARALFNTFLPDNININIDQISGEFHDNLLDGLQQDTVGFGLSKVALPVRFHKYYPKLYTDIKVTPQEAIQASISGDGLVEHIDADVITDENRNGFVNIRGRAAPAKLNRFLGWLIGGKVHVNATIPVQNGIAELNDLRGIDIATDRRFSGVCKALVHNTLRANHPVISLDDNGKEIIKLKLTPFSESRSNPITRWLAKTANRVFQFFFANPIEIRVGFNGAPYTPPLTDEQGFGSFNCNRFADGLSPWPLSLQSSDHQRLLQELGAVEKAGCQEARLQQLDKVIDHIIAEFRLGNAPSDLSLVREIPVETLVLLVNKVKHNPGHQNRDLARLLFLVANLVEALPEKAVQLAKASGSTPTSGGQPYLLHLIASTPKTSRLANPVDGTIMESAYQDHQFSRLQAYWQNSQQNGDGNIYRPGCEKGAVQECGEKAAEWMNRLGDKMNLPQEVKLIMARDFDFADKLFHPVTVNPRDVIANPGHKKPSRSYHIALKPELDWKKPALITPDISDRSVGSAAA